MAEKLANALERGWHFRRAGHSTVRRIMENGARGCQVIISGKLTGQRHRTEKFKDGHIKYCGQAKLNFMHQGFAAAKLKPGVIGVTVQIMDPNAKLPDEITIFPPAPTPEAQVATPEVAAAAAKADEKKAEEAVAELKRTLEGESPAKLKRVRKKKEGEPQAPIVPGEEEKKIVRKPRKKKEIAQPAAGEAIVAVTPPVQAIVVTEQPKPPAETPEKKAEKAEEKKEEAQ
jgi:small subunit ribosomal protein S3